MKCLFEKLATLRAKSIILGQLRCELAISGTYSYNSSLKSSIKRKEDEILDLQNEIIDFVNNLNGERVF